MQIEMKHKPWTVCGVASYNDCTPSGMITANAVPTSKPAPNIVTIRSFDCKLLVNSNVETIHKKTEEERTSEKDIASGRLPAK